MRSTQRRILAALALSLLASACITTQNHELPVAVLPEGTPVPTAPRARLEMSCNWKINGVDRQEWFDTPCEDFEELALKIFRDSGWFSEIGTDVSGPQLTLRLGFTRNSEFNEDLAAISGFLWYLIPMQSKISLTVELSVSDEVTEKRISCSPFTDSFTRTAFILLLPAAPFRHLASRRTLINLFQTSALLIHEQGLVGPSRTAVPSEVQPHGVLCHPDSEGHEGMREDNVSHSADRGIYSSDLTARRQSLPQFIETPSARLAAVHLCKYPTGSGCDAVEMRHGPVQESAILPGQRNAGR